MKKVTKYFSVNVMLLILLALCPFSLVYATSISSIEVSPANFSIIEGEGRQFNAKATLDDASVVSIPNAPITIGSNYICALPTNGSAECWGDNTYGQLGDGSTTSTNISVPVHNLADVATAIYGGDLHTCALLSIGAVQCWGGNGYGELGNGEVTAQINAPVTVSGIDGVTGKATVVSTGYLHNCAVLDTGAVKCWGDNSSGQLGNGSTIDSSIPVTVAGLAGPAVAVTTGNESTCALLASGSVQCWGNNGFGQLGNGSTTNSSIPVSVTGLAGPVVAVTTPGTSTCALLASGSVQCWGQNSDGQLGNGSTTDSSIPVTVTGLAGPAIAVTTDYAYSKCALLASGSVQCWGYNAYGQLGNGGTTSSSIPVTVAGLAGPVVAVTTPGTSTCALLASGSVQCWGQNRDGQLGNGSTTNSFTPVFVSGLVGKAIYIASNGNNNTCALIENGSVQCWGNNGDGEIGDGSAVISSSTPVTVTGLGGAVIALTSEIGSTCGLLTNNTVKCWGANYTGQLGNLNYKNSSTPTLVKTFNTLTTISTATSIASGWVHACALLSDGSIDCWGSNSFGQLGAGLDGSGYGGALAVAGLNTKATEVVAARRFTCALLVGGTVQCWGENDYGQIGIDTSTDHSLTPVAISGLSGTVEALSAGDYNVCALISDASIQCWGDNSYGQLGDGATDNNGYAVDYSYTPVTITGLNGPAKAVYVNESHACALLTDGSVQCWGDNSSGQLGDGTYYDSSTPVAVSGLSSQVNYLTRDADCAVLITGALQCWGDDPSPADLFTLSGTITNIMSYIGITDHSCVLLMDGSVQCWGDNRVGQLGTGSPLYKSSATLVSLLNSQVNVLKWSSSNNSIATVSAAGQVFGVSPGTANITASAGGVDGYANVTVNPTYSIGGTVTGLIGSLTLKNNGSDSLTLSSKQNFVFTKKLPSGASYAVTIASQPSQSFCSVSNGAGVVGSSNITSISISCEPTYTVGGSVNGIVDPIVLKNNGADSLTKFSNGNFVFATRMVSGTKYSVTVGTQADGTYCSVSNGVGVVGSSDITSISITCVPTYSVGGTLTGLIGAVLLKDNSADDLTRLVDGSFTFSTKLTSGSSYNVSIGAQPSGSYCTVANGTGTMGTANVTAVSVSCVPTYTIGGTISGLANPIVLQNNGAEKITQLYNGKFAFVGKMLAGATYTVAINTQPSGQNCTVANGSGTISDNVTNIAVTCNAITPPTFSVGGTVVGLQGALMLHNNGADDLILSSDGNFTFSSNIQSGSTYDVSVGEQPSGQTCEIANGMGTISNNVTNVAVTCAAASPTSHSIGGNVTGLEGEVGLENNNQDKLLVSSNGGFKFPEKLEDGSTYKVTVVTQPAGETCTTTNADGTVSKADITNVNVTCTAITKQASADKVSTDSGGGGGLMSPLFMVIIWIGILSRNFREYRL